MNKPSPKNCYELHECLDYLQNKYGYSEENIQKFSVYLHDHYGVEDDSYFSVSNCGLDDLKDDIQDYGGPELTPEIYEKLTIEFGDEKNGYVNFHVFW